MTHPIDMKKIGQAKLLKLKEMCPALVGSKLEGASLFLRYPPRHSYSIKQIQTIAAQFLAQQAKIEGSEEENKRLRKVEEFTKKFTRIEAKEAAEQGDGDE